MTRVDASQPPREPGYYVCWLRLSDRPVVLYWARLSTQWRSGATVMPVVAYMGPLP